jgi:plastocyanin
MTPAAADPHRGLQARKAPWSSAKDAVPSVAPFDEELNMNARQARRVTVFTGLAAGFAMLPTVEGQSSRSRSKVPDVHERYKAVDVTDGGTIEGVILYKGDVPAAERIQIVKDHETCSKHDPTRPRIIVDDKGHVANAVVFLNVEEGKAPPEDEKTPVVDQKSCEFHPHVQVIRTGQTLEIVNNDPVLHNIEAKQNLKTLFNHSQPKQGMTQEEKIEHPGLVIIDCQAHPWMSGYVYVLPHAYHAVTGEDGKFKLTNVPHGEHELHVWQEHLGERVVKIKVEAGKTAELEYEVEAQTRRRGR